MHSRKLSEAFLFLFVENYKSNTSNSLQKGGFYHLNSFLFLHLCAGGMFVHEMEKYFGGNDYYYVVYL